MEAFLLYILKSGICLVVFYVCFKALFSNDTFFRLNRWILLAGTGICMLLPLCRIKTSRPLPLSRPVSQLEMVFHEEAEAMVLPAPCLPSVGGAISSFRKTITGIIRTKSSHTRKCTFAITIRPIWFIWKRSFCCNGLIPPYGS